MNIESDVKYVIVFQSFYITTIEKFMLVYLRRFSTTISSLLLQVYYFHLRIHNWQKNFENSEFNLKMFFLSHFLGMRKINCRLDCFWKLKTITKGWICFKWSFSSYSSFQNSMYVSTHIYLIFLGIMNPNICLHVSVVTQVLLHEELYFCNDSKKSKVVSALLFFMQLET